MSPVAAALLLVAAFKVKHFVADYPLQTPYMLGKFKPTGWVRPLAAHAGVHAAITALVALGAGAGLLALGCALLDFVVHFVMDRVKASPNLMGRWKALSAGEYRSAARMAEYDGTDPELVGAARFGRQLLRHNTLFWNCLGIDQLVHGLTDLAVVALIVLS